MNVLNVILKLIELNTIHLAYVKKDIMRNQVIKNNVSNAILYARLVLGEVILIALLVMILLCSELFLIINVCV